MYATPNVPDPQRSLGAPGFHKAILSIIKRWSFHSLCMLPWLAWRGEHQQVYSVYTPDVTSFPIARLSIVVPHWILSVGVLSMASPLMGGSCSHGYQLTGMIISLWWSQLVSPVRGCKAFLRFPSLLVLGLKLLFCLCRVGKRESFEH